MSTRMMRQVRLKLRPRPRGASHITMMTAMSTSQPWCSSTDT